MSKSYYNTLNETTEIKLNSEKKARKQEDLIFSIFRHFVNKPMTPTEIWEKTGLRENNVPLTSIRRAITNLEKQGKIIKTDQQRDGMYGKKNYCWVYKDRSSEQESLLF